MDTNALLEKLNEPYGLSGYEEEIQKVVESLFSEYCAGVSTDKLGNVIGFIPCGKEGAKKVMIEAHMDEIGMVVAKINDDGTLLASPIGGIDLKILPAAEVIVHGKEKLYGVVGAKPPHLIDKNKSEALSMDDLAIDIGFSKQEAEKLVNVGDRITFKSGYTKLLSNNAASRCHDDRAGIASLILAAEYLKRLKCDFDIYLCATVQEEVGLRGAKTLAYKLNPDLAVSVDVCHGTTPDASDGTFPLGKGPVITIGPNTHRKLTNKLIDIAKAEKIDFQIDVDGGNTGTNAWAIQVAREGIPCILISIPLRYMHTTVETLNTQDVEKTGKLISLFLNKIEGEDICF